MVAASRGLRTAPCCCRYGCAKGERGPGHFSGGLKDVGLEHGTATVAPERDGP